MIRFLLNLLSTLFALIAIAAAILWPYSFCVARFYSHRIAEHDRVGCILCRGKVTVYRTFNSEWTSPWQWSTDSDSHYTSVDDAMLMDSALWSATPDYRLHFAGVYYVSGTLPCLGTQPGRMLLFPLWPFTALILLPAYRTRRYLARRRSLRSGLCPKCSYDLRASKNRCPECGTPIPPAA